MISPAGFFYASTTLPYQYPGANWLLVPAQGSMSVKYFIYSNLLIIQLLSPQVLLNPVVLYLLIYSIYLIYLPKTGSQILNGHLPGELCQLLLPVGPI